MFSLPDLTTLVAVADHGSVRGAASALCRTQPAITQAIRRLEDEAGFPLLDRVSYRARLTEQGESFVKQARQILWHAQRLQSFSSFLATGIEPRLRIEVDSAIPPAYWASIVADVREAFPETVIEIESGEGNSTLRRLISGDADLALLFNFVAASRGLVLDSIQAGTVDFCNAVRSDKAPLLDDDNIVFPQVLVADFAEGTPEFGAIEDQHCWRVSNHGMQAELILAGLGWGTTPEFMMRGGIERGEFQTRACFGLAQRSSHPISLYRRRDAPIGKVAEHIWQRWAAGQVDA